MTSLIILRYSGQATIQCLRFHLPPNPLAVQEFRLFEIRLYSVPNNHLYPPLKSYRKLTRVPS